MRKILLTILKYINFGRYAKMLGVEIGKNVKFTGHKTYFGSEPYLVSFGNNILVSGSVEFNTHDGGIYVLKNISQNDELIKYGKVIINDNCFIGSHSIILPGVEIGKNCVIGAGSVVTKSIPDNSVVAGNPAKLICNIEKYLEKCEKNNLPYDKINYQKNKREELIALKDKMLIKEKLKRKD